MRRPMVAAAVLLLAACSQQQGGSEEAASTDAADSITRASPGVAWRFTYDYALADAAIEGVQERHAARCEQLGPDRCRITGLSYRVGQDEEVSGALELRLQPAIARQFGKAALQDVRGAEGKLIRSEFTGEDVGTGIAEARQEGGELAAGRADLQRRLDALPAGSRERVELVRQIAAIEGEATNQRNAVRSGQQRLTFTPVTLNYYGEGGIPGFRENPLKASYKLLVTSFVTMVSLTLQLIGVLLPWLLLLGLLLLLWRSRPVRAARTWWARQGAAEGYRE